MKKWEKFLKFNCHVVFHANNIFPTKETPTGAIYYSNPVIYTNKPFVSSMRIIYFFPKETPTGALYYYNPVIYTNKPFVSSMRIIFFPPHLVPFLSQSIAVINHVICCLFHFPTWALLGFTQQVVVMSYRRLRITYRSHILGSRIPPPLHPHQKITTPCVTTRKSAFLICLATAV